MSRDTAYPIAVDVLAVHQYTRKYSVLSPHVKCSKALILHLLA